MLKELLNPSREMLKLGAKLLEEHDINNNQTNKSMPRGRKFDSYIFQIVERPIESIGKH
jgi:hypothetical protein